jgi:hypothetical protein
MSFAKAANFAALPIFYALPVLINQTLDSECSYLRIHGPCGFRALGRNPRL